MFTLTKSHVFTVDANLTTVPYDIDLNEDSDYSKYKGKIRDIEIEYLRYSHYVQYGEWRDSRLLCQCLRGQLRHHTKVAGPITFAAGELRRTTDVVWLNKDYVENLLLNGKLSVWVVAVGTEGTYSTGRDQSKGDRESV